MRKILIIITMLSVMMAGNILAQQNSVKTPDELYKQFSKFKKAEAMKISPFMMKVVRTFAKEDSETDNNQRIVLKRTKSMMMVDLSACSEADKAAFMQTMRNITIEGFTKDEGEPDPTKDIITFYKLEGEVMTEMITAIHDKESCTFSKIIGSFDKNMINDNPDSDDDEELSEEEVKQLEKEIEGE